MAWTDVEMDTAIGHMLRIGVMVAAGVVLAGGVMYLHHSHGVRPDYSHFHAVQTAFRSPAAIVEKVRSGQPESIIQLGLLLLIATPIARVVMCVFGFLAQKDRLYFAVSTIVLTVLLYSVFSRH